MLRLIALHCTILPLMFVEADYKFIPAPLFRSKDSMGSITSEDVDMIEFGGGQIVFKTFDS